MPRPTVRTTFNAVDKMSGPMRRMRQNVRRFGVAAGAAMAAAAAVTAKATVDFAKSGDEIAKTSRTIGLTAEKGSADRIIATYLFDLLSPAHSRLLLEEIHRVLRPNGLACLASLTPETDSGDTTIFTQLWILVQRLWPWLVGGCRPVQLRRMLDETKWDVVAHETVSPKGLTSEVLVARKKRPDE